MPKIKPTKSRVFHKGEWVSDYDSYTSISRFLKCPTEYAKFYLTYEKEPVTLPLVLGNAFHGLVEDTLIDKMLSKGISTMTPASIRSRWEQRWLIELDNAERRGAGLEVENVSPEAYFERGRALTDIWIKDWLPKAKPKDVEVPFTLALSGLDRKIYGRLDSTDEDEDLQDLKTSGRKIAVTMEEYRLQFALYHVGFQSLYGRLPKKAWVIRAETKSDPIIEPIDIWMPKAQLQEIFNETVRPTMLAIQDAWKSGVFECTCKTKGHKTVQIFQEFERRSIEEAEQRAKNERILNPEKWIKDHYHELVDVGIKKVIEEEERKKPKLEEIPF